MKLDRRSFIGASAVTTIGVSALVESAKAAVGEYEATGDLPKPSLAKIDQYVGQHIQDWGLPGMTAVVSSPDGTGYVRRGFADVSAKAPFRADHLVQIGSISKMMASLTMWSICEEGKASRDTKILDILTGLKINGGDAITIQHLMNHTSGLPRDAPMVLDDGLWVGFEPGSHWEYCNLGYRMLGTAIEVLDGRPFADAVADRVFRPIGMTASKGAIRSSDRDGYAVGHQPARLDRPTLRPTDLAASPWINYDGASGCIASTAADMGKFVRFLSGLSDGKGGGVLSDGGAKQFLETGADAPGWSPGAVYANGIALLTIDGRRYLHHTGGMANFSSSILVDRKTGVGAFATTNMHYARNYRPRGVTKFACDAIVASIEGSEASIPDDTKPTVDEPKKYERTYVAADGEKFSIQSSKDVLTLVEGDRRFDLQFVGGAGFATDHPMFADTGIDVELEGDAPQRAWIGSKEYLAEGSGATYSTAFDGHEAYVGIYGNDDRSGLSTRVTVRGDRLRLTSAGYATDLERDGAGWRIAGDNPTGARVSFDGKVAGVYRRMIGSGEASYRRFG